MTKKVLIILGVFFAIFCKAQNPSFQWVKTIGTSVDEWPTSIANDSQGNIYVIGNYKGGDLDPGPATYSANLIGGNTDLFISKFDPAGNFVWGKIIGSTFGDMAYSIAVDDSGYVYTDGTVSSGADFDTGPGTYTVSGGAFISKMDNNGTLVWVKSIVYAGLTYNDKSLVVDKSGSIYFSGNFSNTVDFNPGAGVFNITAYGSYLDIFVAKLNSQGNFVWAKRFGGGYGDDKNPSLTIDSLNNLYLSGSYSYSIDCDPGPGTYTLTTLSGSGGLFISKLDSAGNFVWAKSIGDSGGGAVAKSIKSDVSGNIYLSGNFGNTVDFDPGPGTYTVSSAVSSSSIFILKLNTIGDFVWAKAIGGGGNNIGTSLTLDKFGNMYLTGSFYYTMDFDPGPGTYSLVTLPSSDRNIFVAKYDTTGNIGWAVRLGGSTSDGYGITVDSHSNVYTTASFYGTMDFDPSASIYYQSSNGGQDICIHKMNDCSVPINPINITTLPNRSICLNNTHTLTVQSSGITEWYASPTSTNVIATGNTFSPPLMSLGTYTYYVLATTCTTSISRTAIVYTVNPLPTLSITPTTSICIGSSSTLSVSGANTYTWNTGVASSSVSVIPSTSSIYSVTGTDVNNCSQTQTVSITVDPTCADVWPGDVNSDGISNNLDVLELGLHFTQTGTPRASTSNNWQSYFSNNWTGTITNGKNLNHSDCNGDGTINDNDTLAIYNNYALTHAFKPAQTNTVNPQLSIIPDQTSVLKGAWGTASIYLGDAATNINNINGVAFTVDFDNSLIETNNIYIEYQNSFLDLGQNLDFRKLDFANSKLFTASTHTVSNNVNGFGKIATLHYQIKSSLTTDQVLNLGISQANQSDASGMITPLTSGTGTLMAMGTSVGLQELSGSLISISPNPTNESLTINSKTELQKIEVVSITGALLLSENPTHVYHTLHLENFANGIYFVNVYQNDRVVKREKIVLNK